MAKIRKKIPKKKVLERPEELFSFYERIIEYVRKKRGLFFLSSGIIFILILILGAVFLLNLYYNKKATQLEYEAYKYYIGIANETSQEKRYENALSLYQELVSRYPRTKKAPLALYGIGNCYLQLKRLDEAEKSFTSFIEKYPKDKVILPLVYQKLGSIYEIKGEKDRALNAFERVIGLDGALKDFAYIKMGQIYESQGKKEEALKSYQKIIEGFPHSPWLPHAKKKVGGLKK